MFSSLFRDERSTVSATTTGRRLGAKLCKKTMLFFMHLSKQLVQLQKKMLSIFVFMLKYSSRKKKLATQLYPKPEWKRKKRKEGLEEHQNWRKTSRCHSTKHTKQDRWESAGKRSRKKRPKSHSRIPVQATGPFNERLSMSSFIERKSLERKEKQK